MATFVKFVTGDHQTSAIDTRQVALLARGVYDNGGHLRVYRNNIGNTQPLQLRTGEFLDKDNRKVNGLDTAQKAHIEGLGFKCVEGTHQGYEFYINPDLIEAIRPGKKEGASELWIDNQPNAILLDIPMDKLAAAANLVKVKTEAGDAYLNPRLVVSIHALLDEKSRAGMRSGKVGYVIEQESVAAIDAALPVRMLAAKFDRINPAYVTDCQGSHGDASVSVSVGNNTYNLPGATLGKVLTAIDKAHAVQQTGRTV